MEETGDKRFDAALALLEERRFLEAVDAFSDLVAVCPELTGAYGNRGLAYLNLGLEDEARHDFETVLQLDPDDAMGHSMLAELARFRGTPEQTLAHVAAALDLDEDEPQAHFIRGWLFAKAGQYDMAVQDLERYSEMAGRHDEIEDFIAACRVLASNDPRDESGQPLDPAEAVNKFLGRRGWSFADEENPDYLEEGLPCPYAHCIRNRPSLSPETPEGCPVFGYACPGQGEQVAWCREHQSLYD
ncbi:MAG: tetratricopeptide repeat protein [Planctomycetes bacterium]|nr:tetratricopeptide repeat protein [Planctomycetota bacterium]